MTNFKKKKKLFDLRNIVLKFAHPAEILPRIRAIPVQLLPPWTVAKLQNGLSAIKSGNFFPRTCAGSPSLPAIPVSPALPANPGFPAMPSGPRTPFGPGHPKWPANPCSPTGPIGPCVPVGPCKEFQFILALPLAFGPRFWMLAVPLVPSSPGFPIAPGMPRSPGGPICPGKPEVPANQILGIFAKLPGVPDRPGVPAMPRLPRTPQSQIRYDHWSTAKTWLPDTSSISGWSWRAKKASDEGRIGHGGKAIRCTFAVLARHPRKA